MIVTKTINFSAQFCMEPYGVSLAPSPPDQVCSRSATDKVGAPTMK